MPAVSLQGAVVRVVHGAVVGDARGRAGVGLAGGALHVPRVPRRLLSAGRQPRAPRRLLSTHRYKHIGLLVKLTCTDSTDFFNHYCLLLR